MINIMIITTTITTSSSNHPRLRVIIIITIHQITTLPIITVTTTTIMLFTSMLRLPLVGGAPLVRRMSGPAFLHMAVFNAQGNTLTWHSTRNFNIYMKLKSKIFL